MVERFGCHSNLDISLLLLSVYNDPTRHHLFMNIFDELTDKPISDEKVKMTRLIQYMSSTARDAIKDCIMADGGYKKARDILHKCFGMITW